MSRPSYTTRLDAGLLVLRVGTAVVVLFHGVYKLMNGVEWIREPLGALGLPGFLAYGTYAAEVVAPALLIVGILTRLSALTIAFDMLMAGVLVLRPQLFAVKEAGGGWGVELEALIFFAAVAIALAGSGRYALRPGR